MINSFISVRPVTEEDIGFYASLFRNPEWMAGSGFRLEDFRTDEQLLRFMKCHHPLDLKLVIRNNSIGKDISFCHFKHVGENDLELSGGVIPELLGRGFGLYLLVLCLDYAFRIRKPDLIHSHVMESNSRSYRMHEKTGFRIVRSFRYDVRLFNDYAVSAEQFYSVPFNRYCLERNGILCEDIQPLV
ncbi:MAG: GNAT family N-acetyltransferase [Bacteroidales bacterium]|nr:GNAT family N-acetyltransferase [Bacteroidales bacterium]